MPSSAELATESRGIRGAFVVGSIAPDPTEEEVAAIVAAIEVTWPRAVIAPAAPQGPPPWRFSTRWWRKPIAARRERPW